MYNKNMEALPMKTFWNIMKILAVLAAVASVVFVIIKYGEKILAWFKKILAKFCPRCCDCVEEVAEVEGEAAEADFATEN